MYDIILTLTESSNDIQEIYSFLQENFTNKYVEYYDSLERYSSNQNTKNYYILFSIVSQILGLTFLLLLFRNLINENI
jgi:valyl-tRNA synthetase